MEGDTMTEKESYELTASNNKRYIAGIMYPIRWTR